MRCDTGCIINKLRTQHVFFIISKTIVHGQFPPGKLPGAPKKSPHVWRRFERTNKNKGFKPSSSFSRKINFKFRLVVQKLLKFEF